MKNKGFTIVELLAIFTLLTIILLISVPQITSLLKKSKDDNYEIFLNNVAIACEAYVGEVGYTNLPSNKIITIGNLVDSGYLKSTLKDPSSDVVVSTDSYKSRTLLVSIGVDGVLECNLQ